MVFHRNKNIEPMGKDATGEKPAVSGDCTLYLLKALSKLEGQQQRK